MGNVQVVAHPSQGTTVHLRVNFHFPITPLPRGKHQRVQAHVMNRVAFLQL